MKTGIEYMGSKLTIVVLAMLFTISCKSNNFVSVKRDKNIVVDGSIDDWRDNLNFVKDQNISLGISNDESNLYISIASTERNIIFQVLTGGFTVWFDNKGGKNKNLGIRYPIGGKRANFQSNKRPDYANRELRNRDDLFGERSDEFGMEFELLLNGSNGNTIFKIPKMNEIGIEVIAVVTDGLLVYELKIPLKESTETPYSINFIPGSEVGIGFVTTKTDLFNNRRNGRPGGGRRGGSGGRGGAGGGGAGRGGGMRRGNMSDIRENLDYWAKVTLAKFDDNEIGK